METWIALFRGINVGGNNVLPMADLRASLESLKLKNVRTYIQSGNVVFESSSKKGETIANKIAAVVKREFGFSVQVLVLHAKDFLATMSSNPFAESVADPKSVHLLFLREASNSPQIAKIDEAKAPSEDYRLTDRVFYLHAPDGIARSKLAANVEKYLGVTATGRNLRTVTKVASMCKS
ncbi:MAG: DUF1697 domain-containing protein [Planctomycetota bacterium]